MSTKVYGCFYERNDEFVQIGTFESDEDAYIAAAEHGLVAEGDDFYVAPAVLVQSDAYTVDYEPGCDHKFVTNLHHGNRCFYCGEKEAQS